MLEFRSQIRQIEQRVQWNTRIFCVLLANQKVGNSTLFQLFLGVKLTHFSGVYWNRNGNQFFTFIYLFNSIQFNFNSIFSIFSDLFNLIRFNWIQSFLIYDIQFDLIFPSFQFYCNNLKKLVEPCVQKHLFKSDAAYWTVF